MLAATVPVLLQSKPVSVGEGYCVFGLGNDAEDSTQWISVAENVQFSR
jgi:hypothetical protein